MAQLDRRGCLLDEADRAGRGRRLAEVAVRQLRRGVDGLVGDAQLERRRADGGFEDRACRSVSLESGVRVLSVGYRLSPEVKFPAPVEDCVAAALWAQEHARALRVDPSKIALGGASAGANLAMAATLMMRDGRLALPRFLLLLYGVYAMRTDTESYRLFGDGNYGLGAEALDFFMSLCLRDAADRANPLASPVLADLRGLPPAFVAIAGLDPLRDDSRALTHELRAAGVAVEAKL